MLSFDSPWAHQDLIERFSETRFGLHGDYWITGSSLHLAKIISEPAASSEIFRITKPLRGPNMTYQIELHIPAIKGENSSSAVARNTSAAAVIAAGEGGNSSEPFNFRKLDMNQLEHQNVTEYIPMKIGYFAMIPQDDERMTRPWEGPGGSEGSEVDNLSMNQLWVLVADHGDDNSTNPRFLTCKLWNASLSLNISYLDDVQSIRPENFTYVNEVKAREYWQGIIEFPNQAFDIANMVYSVIFWGICKQLTGFVVSSFNPPNWDLRNEASIKDATLTGASEFVAMMKNLSDPDSVKIPEDSAPLNRPLNALIEELSLNTSLNLLTDPYLRHSVPRSYIIICALTPTWYSSSCRCYFYRLKK